VLTLPWRAAIVGILTALAPMARAEEPAPVTTEPAPGDDTAGDEASVEDDARRGREERIREEREAQEEKERREREVIDARRYIFPLWGVALAKRGVHLPLPWGVTLSNVYISQFVDLTDLRLSFGDDPLEPIEFIEFGDNRVWVEAINARVDLWVLPMLSVYYMGLFSPAGRIDVDIQEPVEVPAGKDIVSLGHGFGLTGVYGYKGTFVAADTNWAWVFPNNVDGAVKTWIASFRLGRNEPLPKNWQISYWTGVMHQKFGRETLGTVLVKDVLPPFDYDGARENCAELSVVQGAACTALVDRLEENQPLTNASINYGITKGPRYPWNMIVGVQVSYTKHWQFRTEIGFLTKFSVMAMATYRFGIPFLKAEKLEEIEERRPNDPMFEAPEPAAEPEPAGRAEPAPGPTSPPPAAPEPLWQLPAQEPTPVPG